MKKRILALFILILLFIFVPISSVLALSREMGDENEDGLISFEEKGDIVVMIQTRLRELGYFNFKSTGRYQGMTRNAVITFQQNQVDGNGKQIMADGTVGAQSLTLLFSTMAVRSTITQSIPSGPRATGNQKETGQTAVWGTVKEQLEKGSSYTLMDFNTGKTFSVVYTGGVNHAEVECNTAADTSALLESFGGSASYFKRPMLLSLNGKQIACSLQAFPHGDDTISQNDLAGHLCLFFEGSKSHVGGLADVEHNANIFVAAGR